MYLSPRETHGDFLVLGTVSLQLDLPKWSCEQTSDTPPSKIQHIDIQRCLFWKDQAFFKPYLSIVFLFPKFWGCRSVSTTLSRGPRISMTRSWCVDSTLRIAGVKQGTSKKNIFGNIWYWWKKSGDITSWYGSLSHYLQVFSTMSGGDLWTINSALNVIYVLSNAYTLNRDILGPALTL